MICFLTSSPVIPGTEDLNPNNYLIDELRQHYPKNCHALYICSDPDNHESTDLYAGVTRKIFRKAGFRFRHFRVLDGRNEEMAWELIQKSNFIILTGGHVPTQNAFFHRIGLREALGDYHGIIFGISAGSMNSADVVYAQPELEGETLDPDYQRWLEGLGLTQTMLLPHLQEVWGKELDGLRVIEDISCADSFGNTFFAIPDGSYLFIHEGGEQLRGEAYRISDGEIEQVSEDGDFLEDL